MWSIREKENERVIIKGENDGLFITEMLKRKRKINSLNWLYVAFV